MWPFEGRLAELASIHAAFAGSAVDGLMICAPPGIGKTRLAREAQSALVAGRTVWVGATRAAATIPFAAVAPLIPDVVSPRGSLEVVRAAARQVSAWGGRRRVAIAIDDAHLLDDASATVVAHLVTHRLAFVLLTARAGEPVSDALMRLVKDGPLGRIDLQRLPEDIITKLIEHAGTGPIGVRARQRIHQLAQGNPLALRELLHGAQPGGLIELITSRLDSLDPGTRQVVELVACGEPLPGLILEQVAGHAAVISAEDRGLIAMRRDGERLEARLDHPLYGDVLRSRMRPARAAHTYRLLADALLSTPMRRRSDVLLAARWQLEAGVTSRPDVMLSAAWLAVGHEDLHLAERLARAARAAEPGAEADRLLAEILSYRGQTSEAARILPDQPPAKAEDRAIWAVTRAETLYWGDGDIESALSTLDIDDPLARANMSWLLFFDARCAESAQIAKSVLADPDAGPKARIWAAAGACGASGFLGRVDDAVEFHRYGASIAAEYTAEVPWGMVEMDTGLFYGLLSAGYPERAQQITSAGYQAAIQHGAVMMIAGWALYGGFASVARGHLAEADRLLAEAQEGFTAHDSFRQNRLCRAARAAAAALQASPGANDFMHDAFQLAHPSNKVFGPWFDSWRAWVAYANGDLATALHAVANAITTSASAGFPAQEAMSHYDLVRLGGKPDLSRLDSIEGDLAPVVAQAARAHLSRAHPHDLEAAADEFLARGYDLHAAEAYTVAAYQHRRLGHVAHAELASAKAATLPLAHTPLRKPNRINLLSQRERQIALLAAHQTSAQIAAQLGLAVPTVNNNLARVYSKLGISGRAELRSLLGEAGPG